MKLLIMTEDGLSELCALCDIPEMGLVPLGEVSARLTEVDIDDMDKEWHEYLWRLSDTDIALGFSDYLLAHIKEVK